MFVKYTRIFLHAFYIAIYLLIILLIISWWSLPAIEYWCYRMTVAGYCRRSMSDLITKRVKNVAIYRYWSKPIFGERLRFNENWFIIFLTAITIVKVIIFCSQHSYVMLLIWFLLLKPLRAFIWLLIPAGIVFRSRKLSTNFRFNPLLQDYFFWVTFIGIFRSIRFTILIR